MKWICEQEGIQADPEAFTVLAQSGEGSVRDSLSALDQAIACFGSTMNGAEVRTLLGMFSLESLEKGTEALLTGNGAKMLDIVDELERNGRNLQHFCRELARYFRNLLVAKVAGTGTRLIAAAPHEQERLGEVAGQMSEQDLSRYLQLTLDLFKDLQTSLQPRLHLELGLLRLVHAGKLLPIEEALAAIGTAGPSSGPVKGAPERASVAGRVGAPAPLRSGPSPFERDAARKSGAPPAPKATEIQGASGGSAVSTAPAAAPASAGEWKAQLLEYLNRAGMTFTADAVEHAAIAESADELQFTAPVEFGMALKSADLAKAIQAVSGRPRKIKVSTGEAAAPSPAPKAPEDDVSRRALAHPEVQRFQELFPNSQVRQVRDLKD
jgi:DNA polymerase-3 subunit gamma/tau